MPAAVDDAAERMLLAADGLEAGAAHVDVGCDGVVAPGGGVGLALARQVVEVGHGLDEPRGGGVAFAFERRGGCGVGEVEVGSDGAGGEVSEV